MRYLYCLYLLVLCGWSGEVSGQDPFFSQFYANRVYLNPAYAGFDGGTQLTLNYRDQWFGVPDAAGLPFTGGYRTMNATLNQRLPCFGGVERVNLGVAGSAFRDQTGLAPFTTSGAAAAVAFEYAVIPPYTNKRKGLTRFDVRAGAQVGAIQSTLESDYLIYSHQLDPVAGLLGSPSAMGLSTGWYQTLNVGMLGRGAIKHGRNSYTLFTLGASIANLNEPDISLYEGATEVVLPRRTTVHLGFTTKLVSMRGTRYHQPVLLSPQFRWDTQVQGALDLLTVGAFVLSNGLYMGAFYQFNPSNQPAGNTGAFIGGRNTAAAIVSVGMDVRSLMDSGRRHNKRASGWIVGLSYDMPVGGLGLANSSGSLELNFRIMLHQLSNTRCSVLGKNEQYKGAKCPVNF